MWGPEDSVPHDKDEWFEDYERELDEQEQYGENWD